MANMMATTYAVLYKDEALKLGYEDANLWYDYNSGLFELDENGKILRLVFCDGFMEPEDAIFGRDLDDFVYEIKKLSDERNKLIRKLEEIKNVVLPLTVDFRYNVIDDTWEIFDTFNGNTLMTISRDFYDQKGLAIDVVKAWNNRKKCEDFIDETHGLLDDV